MQDPLELCARLDDVVATLEATPGTEVNLEAIKNATACGFRAISDNIRSAYEASKTPAPAPEAPSEQPGNSDPAKLAGIGATAGPEQAAAVEGSAD